MVREFESGDYHLDIDQYTSAYRGKQYTHLTNQQPIRTRARMVTILLWRI